VRFIALLACATTASIGLLGGWNGGQHQPLGGAVRTRSFLRSRPRSRAYLPYSRLLVGAAAGAASGGEGGSHSLLRLKPKLRMNGTAKIPGSKSISNRALILAAIAKGETVLDGLLESDDVRVLIDALGKLGVAICKDCSSSVEEQGEGRGEGVGDDAVVFTVSGTNGYLAYPAASSEKKGSLWMGNAGTAMRSMTAVLCAGEGNFTLEGDPRMHQRPISDLVSALQSAGFGIDYLQKEGCPPLRIRGKGRRSINDVNSVDVDGSVSSQFISALLIAAPILFRGPSVEINVSSALISAPYVSMTVELCRMFGAQIDALPGSTRYNVNAVDYKSPGRLQIEPDASSASYFFAGGFLTGGPVTVHGFTKGKTLQGDLRFLEVLTEMGAKVEYGDDEVTVSRDDNGLIRSITADLNDIPDAAMTVAVLAAFAEGRSRISGIQSWRVKECDRLDAMTRELSKAGAEVRCGADWIEIDPNPLQKLSSSLPPPSSHVRISTYNDHRIAMSLSLLSLGPKGMAVEIEDPGCVSKTFPEYFKEFFRLT